MTDTNIVTPKALVQTTNGKRFYIYSGEKDVTNVETTMINVDNIGERDIKLHLKISSDSASGDDLKFRLLINGIIIQSEYFYSGTPNDFGQTSQLKYIIPANTSLKITLDNMSSATARSCNVTGYGRYLSMD